MNLDELYAKLSYGELSNLSLANDGIGTVKSTAKPKIVQYANEALTRLHTRFLLRENDLMIELSEYITNYHLRARFAQNAGAALGLEEIRYILDLPNEPFKEDVAKVLEVIGPNGTKLPLNDENKPGSVFTPQPLILQVPMPEDEKVISVHYQALHPKLDTERPDDLIELPESLVEAFTAYIAYKVFSHMNTPDATAKAQEHLGIFSTICAEIQEQDITNQTPNNSYTQFELRGWV